MSRKSDLKVGIAGFGNVGRSLAARLTANAIPGVTLFGEIGRAHV